MFKAFFSRLKLMFNEILLVCLSSEYYRLDGENENFGLRVGSSANQLRRTFHPQTRLATLYTTTQIQFIRGSRLFTDFRLILPWVQWRKREKHFLQPARYCFFHLKLRICYKLTRHSSLVRFSLKRTQTRWHLSWKDLRGEVAAGKIR